MYWEKASEQDCINLDIFLTRYESFCQNIVSRIYRKEKLYLPENSQGRLWLLKEDKEIQGVVLQQLSGYWMPFFLPVAKKNQEINSRINELVPLGMPFGLMGLKEDVTLFEKELDRQKDSIDYHYMINRNPKMAYAPRNDIRKAGIFTGDKILPLELAYQKEEVYRDSASIDAHFIRKLFFRQLKKQIVLWGQKNGIPVCKGNTNGIGKNYDQIGGVYTHKEYRSQGWGEDLVNFLCSLLAGKKRKSLLFVKKENIPAFKLYEKCGFEVFQEFRITYY